MLYKNITELIGNTPLLKIDRTVHGIPNLNLYAKLEYMNPFGSVKDRAVWGILRPDLEKIQKDGSKVLEMSSGNTAKAIQSICSQYGIPFKTITNRIKVQEVKDTLLLQGVEIEELPGSSDCHDPNDPNDPLVYIHKELTDRLQKKYFTSQYNNERNLQEHYETTGAEILADLTKVDYYFAGLGTTGSSRGPASRIRERDTHLKMIGVVANKDDYIPGIRTKDEMYEVGLLQPDFYDEIVDISAKDATEGMIELIRKCGVHSGPTGGAVYQKIKQYFRDNPIQEELEINAVFIVCDRMENYISYVKERQPEIFGEDSRISWKDRSDDTKQATELEPTQASELIHDPSWLVVDTRSPLAFKSAHIANSLNIAYDHLDKMLNDGNPFCLSNKLLFVCALGEKSRKIASYCEQAGSKAYSLAGGITSWRDKNLPLERDL